MPHPRGFEQHVLPREPYTQSAPTQKPVPPLINVRLVWRDAFDNRISSTRRVLFGGKYMYLRLLLRDVLSILARNGAERRRSGAWSGGTATAELGSLYSSDNASSVRDSLTENGRTLKFAG